ncbi:hypothetical protein Pla123a_10420 [Posidoniimonas polymericola]|uniref:Methyltransferase FkbM domain-containing protein n=1 Tax=Posidoniimonas polymericola TaxID=2528002 RepID=A0A5C5YTW8_9BACT|nr:FkbM family methyltransferase [Posidoniimonas polymericola]TWT78251.1 hypothetical protein Pla123a_10420 [Posidoniimonas polymericola]
MSTIKTYLRKHVPQSIRGPVENTLAAWKSRKYANPNRAQKLVGKASDEWLERIAVTVSSPDNDLIPRVANAGELAGGVLTMHNGIRVGGLSYCGAGMLNLMIENRGVHEPQEELAFTEVLKHIKPGGTMLELGAYWGFYSLWFAKEVDGAVCHLVEPHPANILSGKQNFQLNHRGGRFHRAYVGADETPAEDGTRTIAVDSFCTRHGIKQLAMLHADIQGAEADMLHGARRMLTNQQVDFVFVSTHSNELHEECEAKLKRFGYLIMASANLDETFSVDGVIVARRPGIEAPETIDISKRRPATAAAAA